MLSTMRALRFHGPDDLRLESVEMRPPEPGEVVVDVEACGVCGSDLHFLDGTARTGIIPVTLGHEISGRVRESTDAALQPGDGVVAQAGLYCGTCDRCLEDRPTLCRSLQMTGIDFDGGLADAVVFPADALLPRPPGVAAEIAATAVDAGATAYHAVTRRGGVTAGDAVAIVGVGGLGTFGVQIAKKMGAAPVIAVDADPAALQRAEAMGADEVIVAGEGSVGRAVKLLTDGGVDVAIEFVGQASTLDAAVKSLRPGGRAVAVGVGIEALATLPPVLWATQEYELVGAFGSLPGDAKVVLGWLDAGNIAPPPIETVPLSQAAGKIMAVARGERRPDGRMIVVPD